MINPYPISIFDENLVRLAILDDYDYFTWTRNLRRPNSFELRVNRYKDDASQLDIGHYIVVFKAGAYRIWRIESLEINLTEEGKQSEQWIVRGRSLAGVFDERVVQHRITNSSTQGLDTQTGSAETLLKHFVNVEAVNPTDPNRSVPNLVIAPDQLRGPTFTVSGRLQTLSELLEIICFTNGLGYLVFYDLDNQEFVFEVIEGKDRSVGNGVNPVVIFSPDYDNIKNMTYQNSVMNSKNVAIVAGQGTGFNREFAYAGTGVGLDRREIFVDARDVVEAGLEARGNERLSEYEQTLILEFDHTQIGPFQYEVDFDLGDIVTVIYPNIAQADLRIVKVEEYVTRENGWYFKLTVGNEFPDLINILKKERKNVAPELRR